MLSRQVRRLDAPAPAASSVPAATSDPPASLASPTLELFPPGQTTSPVLPRPATAPWAVSSPGDSVQDLVEVSTGKVLNADLLNPGSGAAAALALSLQGHGSPKAGAQGFKRLYSEVLSAPLRPPAASTSLLTSLQPPSSPMKPTSSPAAAVKDFKILKSGRRVELSSQNLSASRQGTGGIQVNSDSWKEVRGKHWWRKSSAFNPPNNKEYLQSRRARFLQHMEGKCFWCLSTEHQVFDCRDPLRCWRCLNFGHRASSCSKKADYKSPSVPHGLSTAAFPPLAPLRFPPRSIPTPSNPLAMDDLTARPLLDSVVMSATGEIERNRERFSARSLVAWQVGANEGKVELNTFADDVRSAFRISCTYDLWIWTDEPRAIPRGGTFAITSADEEGLSTDIPLPDLEPLRNPPPSDTKKGWTYNVLVHVDTLEDLLTRKAHAYKWEYDVQDDGTRYREYPLPCRAEPDPSRGPTDDDDDKDRDKPSRSHHRSRSLWDRLGRRSSSCSREPERDDGRRQGNEDRGRPRNRERSGPRSRSGRSREPSEGQGDVLSVLESHLDPMLHEASVQHSIYSPDNAPPRVASPVFVLSSFAEQGTPHTNGVATDVQTQAGLVARQGNRVEEFISALSTPLQQPLLPAPDVNARCPSYAKVTIPAISSAQRHSKRLLRKKRAGAKLETLAQEILSNKFCILDDHASFDDNIKKIYLQRYRKPLSPSSLKTIAELVEKGGCKTIRLKAAKKKVAVAPLSLGQNFVRQCVALPADGTKGGLLLACNENFFSPSDVILGQYSLSATVTMREEGLQWSITVVYGPQLEADKVVFLSEIESLQPSMKSEWLIIGDFNLIYKASDKNNDRLNRRMMQRFRGLLDKIQVKELQLPGRRFTWAGEGANPT
ncbi:hypothetical protein OsJ_13829 [Oryza sativa Japonica Group]|uniref:CCHC-type domain-containing protein n=1 Tax=Oryza sativa subsp. japonica TaxID=39947 RepID=B9FDP5_ORYSJ|nr:hypothetical protein OsJ_13829 [Oryza sativa Japonica Group]